MQRFFSALLFPIMVVIPSAMGQSTLHVLNEIALRVEPSLMQPPFVESYCGEDSSCAAGSVLFVEGNPSANQGWVAEVASLSEVPVRDHLWLVELSFDRSGSTSVLLVEGSYRVVDTLLVAPYWREGGAGIPVDTVRVAASGPGRTPRLGRYELQFSDSVQSVSIASGLPLPFTIRDILRDGTLDAFVPDVNRNGQWDMDEQIIIIEDVDGAPTATWQVEFVDEGVRPAAGDTFRVSVVHRDLDRADAGFLDETLSPDVIDAVAFHDGEPRALLYSDVILGPGFDGDASMPGAAGRLPDGYDSDTVDDWVRGDTDGNILDHEIRLTPGAMNSSGVVQIDRDDVDAVPMELALDGNYPNPFNSATTITYALPQPAEAMLTVFDLLGRTVQVLATGRQPAGTYEVSFEATGLPSGVYFYRLEAGDYVETKSLMLLR
jgi:hypothetical protein